LFADFDAISLDENGRDLCMDSRIVKIPSQEEKQQYCSDIILVENTQEKNRSKNRAKNDISPLGSLKFL